MSDRTDLYHFALSLVILVGGGYLMATQIDLRGEVVAVLGTVVGWWFTKAANGVRSVRRSEKAAGRG
jgi:hypothetical protein